MIERLPLVLALVAILVAFLLVARVVVRVAAAVVALALLAYMETHTWAPWRLLPAASGWLDWWPLDWWPW